MTENETLTPEPAPAAVAPGSSSDPNLPTNKQSLGRLLVQMGRLTAADVERVLDKQREEDCSFGDAAVALGLVQRSDIMDALARQYRYPTLRDAGQTAEFMSAELVVGHDPFGAAAEEFRAVRATLLHAHLRVGHNSLAIVGAEEKAGTTYFAANLALSIAQMTLPTILVETNMRSPRIAEMWNLSRRTRGLSEMLRLQELDETIIIRDVVPNLSILLSGAEPPNPQELLGSSEFATLHGWLEERYRAVIYDTPPARRYADARVVAAQVGSAVVVGRRNRTKLRDVVELVDRLEKVGCKVVGSILNGH